MFIELIELIGKDTGLPVNREKTEVEKVTPFKSASQIKLLRSALVFGFILGEVLLTTGIG